MITGYKDITDGLGNWRVWFLLGGNNLRQRYARSFLGQWWIVAGTAITTTAFGLLWSQLWKQSIATYLPYVAIGHICWTLITGPMMDGIQALPATGYYFVNQRAAFSTIFFAGYFRNLLIFLHNFIIVIAMWLIFKTPLDANVLLVFPALLIAAVISVNASIIIGLISCRFRDAGQMIGNLLQVVYFLTPVMWLGRNLKPSTQWLLDWNPFAQILFMLRGPLIGVPVALHTWVVCAAMAIASSIIATLYLQLVNRRIVYWL